MEDASTVKPTDIIVPKLKLHRVRLSDFSRERVYWYAHRKGWIENELRRELNLDTVEHGDRIIPAIAGGMASFSDYLENKVLDYIFNDPSTAFISADPYLGLWTSALTDASTGATAGEAAYTGYARLQVANTNMSAAAAGSKTNSAQLQFAACTALSATVTFFGTFDALTVGNMLLWGTVTSTTVDTSHTPATVAIGALVATLD